MAPTPTLGLSSFLEVVIPGNFSASQLPWAHHIPTDHPVCLCHSLPPLSLSITHLPQAKLLTGQAAVRVSQQGII